MLARRTVRIRQIGFLELICFCPPYAQNYMFRIYWFAWNYFNFWSYIVTNDDGQCSNRIFKTNNPNDITTSIQTQKTESQKSYQ